MIHHDAPRAGKTARGHAISCIVLAVFLLQGCATNLSFRPQEKLDGFTTQKVSHVSSDNSIRWEGVRLAFPGEAYKVDFDNERPAVVFGISKTKNAANRTMVFYDYERDTVLWSARSNATNFLAGNGGLVIEGYKKRNVRSCEYGGFIRDAEPGLYMMDGGTMVFNTKKIARIDLVTGDVLWVPQWLPEGMPEWGETRRDLHVGDSFREYYRNGDWLYVVDDWLYGFNLETGVAWNRKLSTSHKGHGEALAKQAAVAFLSVLAGSYSTPTVQTKLYHNENSKPYFRDDRLYIAARDKLCCYGATSGELVWESRLPRDYGGVSLYTAGDHLAVIGKGWKYMSMDYPGNGTTINKDQKPSILLVAPDTGEQTGYLEFEEEGIVNAFTFTNDSYVLLTPTHLYSLSRDLDITGVRQVTGEQGGFLRILRSSDEQLVIRTSTGLLALDPRTMEVLWEKELGFAPRAKPDRKFGGWKEGARWVIDRDKERSCCYTKDGLLWLSTKDGVLKAVDLDDRGRVAMEIPLGTGDFSFDSDGVVAKGEDFLLILPYSGLSRTMR